MKKIILKKTLTMLMVAMFVISFAAVCTSQAAEGDMTIKGKIFFINAEKGQVEIMDESGKIIVLNAGPEIDLKAFIKGDPVTIIYNKDMIIQSIVK